MNFKKTSLLLLSLIIVFNILFVTSHVYVFVIFSTLLLILFIIIHFYLNSALKKVQLLLEKTINNEPYSNNSTFFYECNSLINSIKKISAKNKLLDAIKLNLYKKSSFDNYYKVLIENIGLIFNSPHLAFLLYNPEIDQILFVEGNGRLKELQSQKNLTSIFHLKDKIIPNHHFSKYFKNDFSDLKNIALITMDALNYKGFLLLGNLSSNFDKTLFSKYDSLILEVQNSFNLHINQKILKNKIQELNLLNNLTILIEKERNIKKGIHLLLTYITAEEGLSFNRALFFEKKDNLLIGKYSVGSLTQEEAFQTWENLNTLPLDLYRKDELDVKSSLQNLIEATSFDLNNDLQLKQFIFNNSTSTLKQSINHLNFSKKTKKLLNKFNLKEFILLPMSSYDNILGLIIVDNAFDNKKITNNRISSLKSFATETSLIINNLNLYNEVKSIAIYDKLTSLYNRRFFEEKLNEEFNISLRNKTNLSLIMIDIDHFKNYNDKNGHIAGDTLLETISKLFYSNCRETDFVCRYGGEEFIIILSHTDINGALKLAEKIRAAVDSNIFPFEEKQPNKNLTISLGISSLNTSEAKNGKELIDCADKALYFSKENGRNQVNSFPLKK